LKDQQFLITAYIRMNRNVLWKTIRKRWNSFGRAPPQ
jgi:hypothetical protein